MTPCRWRSPRCVPRAWRRSEADHGAVLRLLAKRNVDLGRTRNLVACRLHALLAELVPGGIAGEIYVSSAEAAWPRSSPPIRYRRPPDLALEHLDDLRRLDTQIKASKQRIADRRRCLGNDR